MPLYDFRCERCGEFRAFRPMADGASAACPHCAVPAARVLVAPFLGGGAAASGWLSQPQRGGSGGGGSWRSACGAGCGCAGCG